MSSYSLKCRKNTESKNPKDFRTENERIMHLSKCEMCDGKNSKFIKEHEGKGLLRSLRMKAPLGKISLLSPFLFW